MKIRILGMKIFLFFFFLIKKSRKILKSIRWEFVNNAVNDFLNINNEEENILINSTDFEFYLCMP